MEIRHLWLLFHRLLDRGRTEAEGKAVSSRGVADADVNRGKLCLKGIFEHELFDSAGRGTTHCTATTGTMNGRLRLG